MQLLSWFYHWSLLRYVVVGGLGYVVDVSTFVLARWLGAPLVLANVLARALGATVTFLGNRYWSFGVERRRASFGLESLRYIALWLFSTGLSTLLLWWGVRLATSLSLAEVWLKGAVEFVIVLFNFLVSRFWVFAGQKKRKSEVDVEQG